MKPPYHKSILFVPVMALAFGAWAVQANAQNYTWISGANTSWDNASAWSPSGPPADTGDIVNSTSSTSTAQIESGTRTIGNILLNNASFNVVGASSSGTSSTLVVTGSVSKTGTGTIVFRDSTGPLFVDIQGGVYVSGGNLRFGSNSTIGISGVNVSGTTTLAGSTATFLTVNLVNGGTANFNAVNFTTNSNFNIRETTNSGTTTVRVSSLSGTTGVVQAMSAGTIANSQGTLLIDTVSTSTFGGVIRNSNTGSATILALVKAGTGTQVLTGSNSYTGGTTITAGSLVLSGNGSLGSGSLAVQANGTLDISGITASSFVQSAALAGEGHIITGSKTFVANGTVNPGDGSGTGQLDVTGNFTLGSSSSTSLLISGTSAGLFDSINVSGALAYGGGLTLSFDSLMTGGIVDLGLFDFASFSGAFSSVSLAGAYSGALSLVGNLWSGEAGGQAISFDQSTGLLNVSAIPEPGAIGLLCLGIMAVLWRRSRRLQA